jgi:hypothetical protein
MKEHLLKFHRDRVLWDAPQLLTLHKPLTGDEEKALEEEFNRRCDDVVFKGGKPFSHFDSEKSPYEHELIKFAARKAGLKSWQPPSRHRQTRRLKAHYCGSIADLRQRLDAEKDLHFCFDESEDPAKRRVFNASVVIPELGSIYLENIDMRRKRYVLWPFSMARTNKLASSYTHQLFHWMKAVIMRWTNQEPYRVASIATDTCSTMRACAAWISDDPDISHVLWVPCDSHGLNLLCLDVLGENKANKGHKDHLSIAWIHETWRSTQKIAALLRKSLLMLAILQDHQQQQTGTFWAIVIGCLTRWGSHINTIKCIHESRSALDAWAMDPDVLEQLVAEDDSDDALELKRSRKQEVLRLIRDENYWHQLHRLKGILQPIQTALKQSEGINSHIGLVYKRWQQIQIDWNRCSLADDEGNALAEILDKRREKQQIDEHILAHALHPAYIDDDSLIMHQVAQKQIFARLRKIGYNIGDATAVAQVHYHQFRSQSGPFAPKNRHGDPWESGTDNPINFWRNARSLAQGLADIAIRLFSMPANSCASERSFSAMKWIQNTRRTRLTHENANMLIFCFMNAKIQQGINSGKPPAHFCMNQLPLKEVEELGQQAFQDAVRRGIEDPEIQDLLAEDEDPSENSIPDVPASQAETQPDTQAIALENADPSQQAHIKASITKRKARYCLRRTALRASAMLHAPDPPGIDTTPMDQVFAEAAQRRERIINITQRLESERQLMGRSRSQTPFSEAAIDETTPSDALLQSTASRASQDPLQQQASQGPLQQSASQGPLQRSLALPPTQPPLWSSSSGNSQSQPSQQRSGIDPDPLGPVTMSALSGMSFMQESDPQRPPAIADISQALQQAQQQQAQQQAQRQEPSKKRAFGDEITGNVQRTPSRRAGKRPRRFL